MFLEVERIKKSFGRNQVLQGVDFSLETGDIAAIIGPSGVGKTTLLSIIAGLESADSGRLFFETPPSKDRPVILVFQDYTLFPNMTVYENAAFGLKARRISKTEIRNRVLPLLDYFQLGDKKNHYPVELSAGQKQRVAIARAMVVEPALLLLDEPFANLDRTLKMDTARFIRQTQKKFGITTIAVTHDLEEAFVMSDKVGLLLDGRLEQFGTVEEIYRRPKNIQVASFMGPVNRIPSTLRPWLGLNGSSAIPVGELFARPEAFQMTKHSDGPGVVEEVTFAGHYLSYRVRLKDAYLTIYSLADDIRVGDRVALKLTRYHES